MATTRRRRTIEDFPIHGTGDAATDQANMTKIEAAIAARKSGRILVSGNLIINDIYSIKMPEGGGIKCVEGGKLSFQSGGIINFGGFTDVWNKTWTGDSASIAINATAEGQRHIEAASTGTLNLKPGDYVAVWHEDEYSTPYTRHSASTKSCPMAIRRVMRSHGSNSDIYELCSPILDALTVSPTVRRFDPNDMSKNIVLENVRYQHNGPADIVTGKNFVGDFASIGAAPAGTSTDDWIFVDSGATDPAGIYFWNGSAWVIHPNGNPQSNPMQFWYCVNARLVNMQELAPGSGQMPHNYCYGTTIEDHYCEEKLASDAMSQEAGYGYVHVIGACHRWRLSNGKFGEARHAVTTGGRTKTGVGRMASIDAVIEHCEVSVGSAGGSSSRLLDTHAEGETITFRHNRVFVVGDSTNHGIQARARNTRILYNEIIGNDNHDTTKLGNHFGSIGISLIAPNCEVAYNTFRGLGNSGVLVWTGDRAGSPVGNWDNTKIHGNKFENIRGPAIVCEVGTAHEITSNVVLDCASVDVGYTGVLTYGKSLIRIFSGTNHIIQGNQLAQFSNDWAIDMDNSTPGGSNLITGNNAAGYTVQGAFFRDDRTSGPSFQSTYEAKNWQDINPAGANSNITTGTVDAATVDRTIEFGTVGNENDIIFGNVDQFQVFGVNDFKFTTLGLAIQHPGAGSPGKIKLFDDNDSAAIDIWAHHTIPAGFDIRLPDTAGALGQPLGVTVVNSATDSQLGWLDVPIGYEEVANLAARPNPVGKTDGHEVKVLTNQVIYRVFNDAYEIADMSTVGNTTARNAIAASGEAETGQAFLDEDTNLWYRYNGTAFVQVNP